MIGALLLALSAAPLAALLGCLVLRRPRVCEALNLTASVVSFACALPIPFLIDGHQILFWNDYVIIDRASAWVVLCTAIVYFLASIYAGGYMRLLNEEERLPRFYALFAGFGLTTLVGPLMNSIGVYWMNTTRSSATNSTTASASSSTPTTCSTARRTRSTIIMCRGWPGSRRTASPTGISIRSNRWRCG